MEKIRIFQKGFNYSQDGQGNRLVNLDCTKETMEHGLILCGAGEIGMQVLEFLADQNEFAPSG